VRLFGTHRRHRACKGSWDAALHGYLCQERLDWVINGVLLVLQRQRGDRNVEFVEIAGARRREDTAKLILLVSRDEFWHAIDVCDW